VYVSKERRMVYLASPKTATKATKEYLRLFDFYKTGTHHDTLTAHPTGDWTVFTTVRNPWDLWVSWFYYSGYRMGTFSLPWLKAWQKRHSTYYPYSNNLFGFYTQYADRILRFETLQDDLHDLLGDYPGYDNYTVELPRINIGANRLTQRRSGTEEYHYREEYEKHPEVRDYIAKQYAEEIALYGYTF